ncbi:hypothetical protein AAF712_008533 [Marasmius tenuissimus]|uniref:Uncharacterized protein n=1 Tax=Marasmius tenuissimus TaxID=585030 RepID=A0ABR2ZT88_9AGAR
MAKPLLRQAGMCSIRDSYFVSTKWVFVHDAAARDRAKKESRKKYEKVKRANRKKRSTPLE